MTQPVKYITIISDMLSIYQKQLISLFKKYPNQVTTEFQKNFSEKYELMRQQQANKSIKQEISLICFAMAKHFEAPVPRINKTSSNYRKELVSQSGHREMRMTIGGQRFKKLKKNHDVIEQQNEIDELIHNYRMTDQLMPKMRMKWKNAHDPQRKIDNKQRSTIGNNNIDLLSYTIPQIQNSIRRLSLQRSPKSVKQRQFDVYRTLESRNIKKKFIPKLF